MRGLKPEPEPEPETFENVARSTRAWIETVIRFALVNCAPVARSTRAWIETFRSSKAVRTGRVARSTRAWIETRIGKTLETQERLSHALRVRGLKRQLPSID